MRTLEKTEEQNGTHEIVKVHWSKFPNPATISGVGAEPDMLTTNGVTKPAKHGRGENTREYLVTFDETFVTTQLSNRFVSRLELSLEDWLELCEKAWKDYDNIESAKQEQELLAAEMVLAERMGISVEQIRSMLESATKK